MKRFLLGVVVGACLGTVASALAARVVGESGYLHGWSVMSADGEEVCSDPYVWPPTHEIECD